MKDARLPRREFLRRAALVGGGAFVLPSLVCCSSSTAPAVPPPVPVLPAVPVLLATDSSLAGGVGSGRSPAENRAALQAGVDRAVAEGAELRIPAGDYVLGGDVLVHGRVRVRLDPGATLRLMDRALLEHGIRNNQGTAHAAAIFWLAPGAAGSVFALYGVLDANADRQADAAAGVPYAPSGVFVHGATGVVVSGDWEVRRASAGVFAIDADDSTFEGASMRVPSERWLRGSVVALEGCRRAFVRRIRAEGGPEAVDLNNANRWVTVEDVVAEGTEEGLDINGSADCTIRDVELRNCLRPVLEGSATGRRHTARPTMVGGHVFENVRIVVDGGYRFAGVSNEALFSAGSICRAVRGLSISVQGAPAAMVPRMFAHFAVEDGEAEFHVESDVAAREDAVYVQVNRSVLRPVVRAPVAAGRALCRVRFPSREVAGVTVEAPVLEQPEGAATERRVGLDLEGSRSVTVSSCSRIARVERKIVSGSATRVLEACGA